MYFRNTSKTKSSRFRNEMQLYYFTPSFSFFQPLSYVSHISQIMVSLSLFTHAHLVYTRALLLV